MNLQFYHGTKAKYIRHEYTVVVDVPNKEELRMNVWKILGGNIKTIELNVGTTKVNPKDQYSRKIGRIESTKNLKLVKLQLDSVLKNRHKDEKHSYVVVLQGAGIELVLEIKEGREKVHLIDATI